MCGILGTTLSTNKNLFKQALDTLTHKRPDDYGIETIDNDIILGHRRLSIIDLSLMDISRCQIYMKDILSFLTVKYIIFLKLSLILSN